MLLKSRAGRLVLLLVAITAGASPAGANRPDGEDMADPVYRANSRVTTDFAGASDTIMALVAQTDGKVVAGGEARVSGAKFALARYRPDGELDRSFGDGGKVTTTIAGGSTMTALALQPDGKLVGAGTAEVAAHPPDVRVALARYLPDGRLDESFGEHGVVVGRADALSYGKIHSIALQPDGRIVVAGEVPAGAIGDSQFALARYLPSGDLDRSFDGDGIVTTDFSPGLDTARAVLVQPDGGIVAVGGGRTGSYAAVARYLPDGRLDPSFGGGGGKVTTGALTEAHGAALQPDGRIVLAGGVLAMEPELAVSRLLADGSTDMSFGGDGQVTTLVGRQAFVTAVLVQPNGKIVAAGAADTGRSPGQFVFVVVRYRPDGTLDPAFHDNGVATTDFTARPDQAHGVTIDSTNHLIAAGQAGLSPQGTDFAVAGLDRPLLDLGVNPAVPQRAGPAAGAATATPNPANVLPRSAPPVPAVGGSKAGAGAAATLAGNGRVVAGNAMGSSAGGHRPDGPAGGAQQAAADVTTPPPSGAPSAVEMEQAILQFARTGRAEPRPDTQNGLVVFLAAVLLLVVGIATVTVHHAARNGVPSETNT